MNILSMEDHLKRRDEKELLNFIRLLTKLSLIEILGIAHMLQVVVFRNEIKEDKIEEAELRPFEDFVPEMLEKYLMLDSTQRKNIKNLMEGKV